MEKNLWLKSGSYINKKTIACDYDLWIRFSKFSEIYNIDVPISIFRLHKNQISSTSKYFKDVKLVHSANYCRKFLHIKN